MTKFSSFSSIHLPPPLFFRGRLWVSIFLISTFPSIHLPTYLLPRLFQLTMKSVGYFFISSSLARRTLQTFHFFINNHVHFTKISTCLDLLPKYFYKKSQTIFFCACSLLHKQHDQMNKQFKKNTGKETIFCLFLKIPEKKSQLFFPILSDMLCYLKKYYS